MKKWSKRVISVLLSGIMVFSLAACGGNKNDAANNEEAKKYVYRMEDIEADILDEETNMSAACYANGRVYMLTDRYYYEEMTGMVVSLVSCKIDGSDVQSVELLNTLKENPYWIPYDEIPEEDFEAVPLAESAIAVTEAVAVVEPLPADEPATLDEPVEEDGTGEGMEEDGGEAVETYEDVWLSTYTLDANGVYLVMESSSYSYDAMGNYMPGEATLEMFAYDLNGKLINNIVINDDQNMEYMWINNITADANGNIALQMEQCIRIIDASGKVIEEIDTSADGYIQNLFVDEKGFLNMVGYNNDWTKMFLRTYNMQTKQPGEDMELPGFLTNYGIRNGVSYDLLLTNSTGLYGYNFGDEETTQILSYINSDMDGTSINQMYEMDDKTLFCTYQDEETWETHLAVCTYVDPADIPDKEVISLACHYLDYYLRRRIIEFNKESEQYRILVKDYSMYDTAEDYTAGVTQLNNDILTGQMPDILILDSSMPVESYVAKGVLADIGKMIEEDEELNMDDYMTNVFDAYSVDGKLYSVIPSFYISTVMGKTADVGAEPGWTMADLQALIDANPNASVFGETYTRADILRNVMVNNGARFIDRDTGKCNFESQEFMDVLEFVAQFPEEFDWDSLGDDYWMSYETQYREGATLLMNVSIGDFQDYVYNAHGYFGEPVTLIGFPAEEGNGAAVVANSQYAIAARSSHKEGAWEFLRYYLTEEYQTDEDEMNWRLPVYKEAILDKLEAAQERPYWEDEEGNKEYYDQYFWAGGEEFILEPLSKEEADALYEYICSVDMAYSYDENLYLIVEEEAAAYFAGQKSVEEVVEIIQSRAQVYINESR
ncbi:MAG: extracellular solute-binding protein [Lachnospiraceae bacterium]|nr:extracellular solute-binding protein [Lachnospiraceae bacterium]